MGQIYDKVSEKSHQLGWNRGGILYELELGAKML